MNNMVKAGLILFAGGAIVLFFMQNFTRWAYEPNYIKHVSSSSAESFSTGSQIISAYERPRSSERKKRSSVVYETLTPPADMGTYENKEPVMEMSRFASGVVLTARLDPTHDDRSGIWQNFNPGPGNANPTYEDWNWTMTLQFNSSKTIKLVSMRHLNGFEAWSTSKEFIYNKQCYPLVIYLQGERLNSDYDQQLGPYGPGQHEFHLFGQMETPSFYGAELTVEFTDGTYARVEIPGQSLEQETTHSVVQPSPKYEQDWM